MGYCLNRLDEAVFIAVPKPLLTEFGIHHRLESCGGLSETFKKYITQEAKENCVFPDEI